MDVLGEVDPALKQVDAQLALGLFGTVEKVLGWVPLAGKVARKPIKICVGIQGSSADPHVLVSPAKGVIERLQAKRLSRLTNSSVHL